MYVYVLRDLFQGIGFYNCGGGISKSKIHRAGTQEWVSTDIRLKLLSRGGIDQRNVLTILLPSANLTAKQACTFIYKAAAQRKKGGTSIFPNFSLTVN